MEIVLKQGLPHQQRAVDAINSVFKGVRIEKPTYYYMNPIIDIESSILKDNISILQENIHSSMRNKFEHTNYLGLDIKMETGTGKTYVYTKTIYELNKQYGINKFIIIVPSLPIKAGIQQFIGDSYVQRHFKDASRYNVEIDLQVLEASNNKKSKKKYFPSSVREFVKGSNQNSKKIYVLLTNMHMLTDRKNSILMRDDYDYGVEGYYCPVDALKATKPFVIIDEPHRFSREQKTFKFIEQYISPQCIIRYGATFPDVELGKGRNKQIIKDYDNLLYDLNACEAFNMNLIKGVAKEHLEPISKIEEKIKVISVQNKSSVSLQYYKKGSKTRQFTLEKGNPLSIISPSLDGIFISGVGKNYIELSNNQLKYVGEEFSTDIYSSSYQEQMIKLALDRHFETEKVNFNRRFKIKTLALFFIDDIYSYRRNDKVDKEPYLLKIFERLLKEKVIYELSNMASSDESEYKEYLLATLADISKSHGGYFSQDNSDSDKEIEKEVNEILFDKKELLSIKHKDGTYNTRRFLFSKWTLKEGWDNPNVFTIAKLRSSGSENSKLQEVGRGLRLPVDENGNRISNEEFTLNYIVDFTEAKFADELVKQINGDSIKYSEIDRIQLKKLAIKLNISENDLFKRLLLSDYIDMDYKINPEKSDQLFNEFPDLCKGFNRLRITDRNNEKTKTIKVREAVFNELKELWDAINQKYILCYDKIEKEYFEGVLLEILNDNVFSEVVISSSRQILQTSEKGFIVEKGNSKQYILEKPLPYGEFLKVINSQTNIPITQIHKVLCKYAALNSLDKKMINEYSATNFIMKFNEWKLENLQGRISYVRTDIPVTSTALTGESGTVKKEIALGRIGTKIAPGVPIEKYLYDTIAYDSPLEEENIRIDNIEEVIVYGKIPRNSVRIPTIAGSTYSPDFMYVVKDKKGNKSLNIVIETKDVENKSNLRGIENSKIECAKIFFKQLELDGYKVEFHNQLNNKKMKEIIEDILKK